VLDVKKPWMKDEFWDNSYKKKYEGDFIWFKNFDRNWKGLREQIAKFFHPDNMEFIRRLIDEFINRELEVSMGDYWREIRGYRLAIFYRKNEPDSSWL
jgi:hypothetical protein